MSSFSTLLQQGNSWLFVPTAILLGALHGLEPGHSKTMMAAFIIAVRGTFMQAVLLGLAATLSHTGIIWIIGLSGLYLGRQWNTEASEPYLQLASAVLIVGVALWMIVRTRRAAALASAGNHDHGHDHGHDHSHDHAHGHDHDHAHDDVRRFDTGCGVVELELSGRGSAARFLLRPVDGTAWPVDQVHLATERTGGGREAFSFRREGEYLESVQPVVAPHDFIARLSLGHEGHTHDYDLEFVEGQHRHVISDYDKLDVSAPGYQDPHELAHANDIRRRFTNRQVTTGQIVVFGLTGGLLPCPAAITVLLVCLQLKKIVLGVILVLSFSVGLAITMVASGALAALGVKHLSRRFGSSFTTFARRAPYFSGAAILLVGLYMGYQGLHALA